MTAPDLAAATDEPAYRWPSRTLRTTILFSLAAHALLGGVLLLGAGDPPAGTDVAGATRVSLRHELATISAHAPATARTPTGDAAASLPVSAPAASAPVASTTAPTAMRVTPVRAIEPAAAGEPAAAPAPAAAGAALPVAADAPDNAAIDDARRRYLAALGPLLRKHLVYPPAAQQRGLEGRVMLNLRIARDGSVQALTIQRSSGEPLLDDGALATVRRAMPLPPLPTSLPEAALDVNVPLSFGLDTRSAPND